LAILNGPSRLQLADQSVALSGISIDLAKIVRLQGGFRLVTEHSNQRRICIEHLAIGRSEKYTFAQGFKEFIEANFCLMLRSNVAGPSANAHDGPFLGDGLNPAVEVAKFSAGFEVYRHSAVSRTGMQEPRQPDFRFLQRGGFDEFMEAMADQIPKIRVEDFSKAAIGDSNLAFQRKSKNRLVEAVDQVAKINLRSRYHIDELFELFFRGRSRPIRLSGRFQRHQVPPLFASSCLEAPARAEFPV